MDRKTSGPQTRFYPSAVHSSASLLQPQGNDEMRLPIARSLRVSASNSSIVRVRVPFRMLRGSFTYHLCWGTEDLAHRFTKLNIE